ncbi:MAG TPA: hypothetical protein VHL79_01340 [Ramlibacter sp.]|jgi:hypothetical protein|nr:hypothetical protein [Ramlibacter sp.]
MLMTRTLSITAPEIARPLQALLRTVLLSLGRGTLEVVEVPPALSVPPSARTRRLVRQARLSAW